MRNDRRKGERAIPEDLRQLLTAAQMKTLDEIRVLGWKLKFVRRPLFQDPIPVISNSENDQIGVLDPDGRISLESDVQVRRDDGKQHADAPDWIEKRSGMAPVPKNLREILNENQLSSLRQIENFGWRLHFVRRPLYQDPVVVIVSAEGDRFGTLEPDGRINIRTLFDIREAIPGQDTDSAAGPGGRE